MKRCLISHETFKNLAATSATLLRFFRIIDRDITDKENREELKKIREALDAFEGSKAPEVIDV